MDAETRGRIFEPFYTTKFAGRGLGLAAVLGIIRGHKGAIKVTSELGKGTTFCILLPAVDRPIITHNNTLDQNELPPSRGMVLFIDDDAAVRDVGSAMLTRLGYQVFTAADGRKGLDIFRTQGDKIACVILDLTMPDMGGEETFRELRKLRGDARVILSSGFDEQDATNKFVGIGLAGFIQKPYSVTKLREALNRAIR
jgi:two-component system cell cycle sensor histidine kinase/response regulator CckA